MFCEKFVWWWRWIILLNSIRQTSPFWFIIENQNIVATYELIFTPCPQNTDVLHITRPTQQRVALINSQFIVNETGPSTLNIPHPWPALYTPCISVYEHGKISFKFHFPFVRLGTSDWWHILLFHAVQRHPNENCEMCFDHLPRYRYLTADACISIESVFYDQ